MLLYSLPSKQLQRAVFNRQIFPALGDKRWHRQQLHKVLREGELIWGTPTY
jgi:hypothetical protein